MEKNTELEIEETLTEKTFIFALPHKLDLDLTILSHKLTLLKNERISKACICREALDRYINSVDMRGIIENGKI